MQHTTTEEKWADIPGYEGCYQVSDQGRIRSFDRIDRAGRPRKGRCPCKQFPDRKLGYHKVPFTKDGALRFLIVHRLVAKAFVPNPDNKPTVNHKNGIRSDNRAANLEWMTMKEQHHHSASVLGTRHRKLTPEQVIELRSHLENRTMTFNQAATHYGIHATTVNAVRTGLTWSWLKQPTTTPQLNLDKKHVPQTLELAATAAQDTP